MHSRKMSWEPANPQPILGRFINEQTESAAFSAFLKSVSHIAWYSYPGQECICFEEKLSAQRLNYERN